MNQSYPRPNRLTALAALLLQLLVAVGLPAVEAVIEHPAPGSRPHIEADRDTPCAPPGHSDLECQICRSINREQLGAARGAPLLGTSCVPYRFVPVAISWRRPVLLAAAVGARAPPAPV